MSNLMGLIYAYVLIMPTILFGIDIFRIQQILVNLESQATAISYQISQAGGVRPLLTQTLENDGITLTCLRECNYISVGQSLEFVLTKAYTPIIVKNDIMNISVTRTTIVGYL